MKIKQRWREEMISIVVVLLFVLGFFVLSDYTGYVGIEFDTEAVHLGTGDGAVYPHNMSGASGVINVWQDINRQVNFTYNVSADNEDYINNCTLWVDIDDAGFEANETLNRSAITAVVNQTFNETFQSGIHDITWKVGCYDNDSAMTNTSARDLYLNYLVTESKPNIGAHAFLDRNYVVMQHRFEEFNGSDFYDEIGLHNGTAHGVKWCPDDGDSQKWNCSGRVGKGVMFEDDGSFGSDYISFGNISQLGSANKFTLSFWMKQDILDTLYDVIFVSGVDENNRITIYTRSTGYMIIDVSNGSNSYGDLDYSKYITAGKWHYLTTVFDGTQSGNANRLILYIDGNQITFDHFTGTIPESTSSTTETTPTLGHSSLSFDGSMDELTIWNRSLSATEVAQLYYSSAVNYNSTFTIQDISASNNNTGDLDNDTIKYIYDWYVNNESMAVLNMPFEAVNNGSEMNFSKDYSSNEDHFSTSFDSDNFQCDSGGICSGWNRTGGIDGFGAYEFDGDVDYLIKEESDWRSNDDVGSLTAWIKLNNLGVDQGIFSSCDIATWSHAFRFSIGTDNLLAFGDSKSGSSHEVRSNTVFVADKWYHVAVTSNGTYWGWKLYINGEDDDANPVSGGNLGGWFSDIVSRDRTVIGAKCGEAYVYAIWNGTIDEFMIFNRTLSAEQVKALYLNQTQTIKSQETVSGQSWKAEITANDGYGDSIEYNTSELWIDDVTLIVSNQAPTNYFNSSTSSVNFTYNVSDGDSTNGVRNCSLWLFKAGSWQRNLTKTDYIPGDETNLTFNITIQDISLNWTIGCWDKDNEQTNSSSWNLTVDTTAPLVDSLWPNNETTYSCSFDDVNFTYNTTDSITSIKNCSLYLGYNSVNANQRNLSDLVIEETVNQTFNISITPNGTWIYWKIGCYNDAILQTNSSLRRIKSSTYCPQALDVEHPGSSSGMGSSGYRTSSTITDMRQTISGNVYTLDYVIPGETELEITDPGLSLIKIILDSAKEAEDVSFIIEEKRNIRLDKPDRRVYRYINVETELPESFINQIKFVFKINKGWGEDIKLLRYTSSWYELETNKVDEDEYYEYYEAISPGFSTFAITAKKISMQEAVEKIAQQVVEKPSKVEMWIYAIIPIIVLILVSLVLLYYFIKLFRKYNRITVVLLGLGLVVLLIPFTTEVLYWAILPLSILVVIGGVVGYIIWFIRGKKK